jgi:SPW repeat
MLLCASRTWEFSQVDREEMSFSLPKEWQDWLNLVIGIWICVSPWALNFTDNETATRTAIAIGFLIVVSEVFTFCALRLVEEWINGLLGAWLVISAWLLDLGPSIAKVDFIASGVAIILLTVYESWDAQREPRSSA